MSKSHFITLFVFLSLCVSTVHAVIVKVDILKGKNPKTDQEQYVYLLSDVHNSMGILALAETAYNQRNALIHMLSACDKEFTKVVIEDSAILEIQDYVAKTKGIKEKDCIKSVTYEKMKRCFDMLPCLSYQIEKLGVETINVEFRLPNYDQGYPVSVSNTINSTSKIFGQISKYNDGNLLNNYYKTVMARVEKDRQMLTDASHVKNLLRKHSSDQIIIKEKIMMFDAQLLDIHALHQIINAQNKEKIFVILGALHICNVKSVLKQLGYEKIVSFAGDHSSGFYRQKRKQLYKKIMSKMSFSEVLNFCEQYKENSDLIIHDGVMDSSNGLNDALDSSIIKSLSQDPKYLMNQKFQNQVSYYVATHRSNLKK